MKRNDTSKLLLERALLLGGFDDVLTTIIIDRFVPYQIPAKHRILEPEQVCDAIIFVTEGYGKIVGGAQQEQVRFFARPGVFLSCIRSFLLRTRSNESIWSITPIKGYVLHREAYDQLLMENKAISAILVNFQIVTLHEIMEEKNIAMPMTAKEKYRFFLEKYGAIANHIPVQDIASYLGIRRQSLSRIRRELL